MEIAHIGMHDPNLLCQGESGLPEPKPRYCKKCKARLSIYNPGKVCFHHDDDERSFKKVKQKKQPIVKEPRFKTPKEEKTMRPCKFTGCTKMVRKGYCQGHGSLVARRIQIAKKHGKEITDGLLHRPVRPKAR